MRALHGLARELLRGATKSGLNPRSRYQLTYLTTLPMNTRLTLAAALTLASSLTALADVKVNDTLSVGGYAVGSYQNKSFDSATIPDTDKFDLDAAKLLFTGSFKPVTGVASVFYQPPGSRPPGSDDITLLDAYATVDVGGGTSITAGKFLSYLGYEAFDIPNMTQVSYANGDFLGPIPGYHSGVKVDGGDKDIGWGLALLDSVYSGPNYLKGDGELKHNAGFEGYLVYKAIPEVTLWAGFAYDTKGNVIHKNEEILTLDFWASYNLTKEATIAAEFCTKDGGPGDKGYNWLAFLNYTFDKNWSSAFRVSGEKVSDGGPEFTKLTVSPTYKINDNFSVRAELSYYDYNNHAAASATFFAVQSIFKF